jgi:acetaldehyde dehydrogenase
MKKIRCAIIGSGNIGTDLLYKLQRSEHLEPVWMVGVDPASEGLARARQQGLKTTDQGVDGLLRFVSTDDIRIAFDATSAYVHRDNSDKLTARGVTMIDLTPAAIGPYCVPPVNLAEHIGSRRLNVNMVTCGGQATIPIVAAVSRVAKVRYAEIVASIASKSAGPGTRANIDEFTETTGRAIVAVGGAERGKAIIVLNPAEPPLIMRDTVYCMVEDCDPEAIAASVAAMVEEVRRYVPGYRLKQVVQFEHIGKNRPLRIPESGGELTGLKVSVFLEVEGAAHYLPAYAGNLDIMTSAALRTAERIALRRRDSR